ncbi:hypothetical protein ACFFLM_25855 [Deinococcus oregonensis]|uniref:Uncharacterized protein n=1 Tax=Deinococcus oregonensis TaxID=1805970 RepID=A0ABV6B6H7_9DEIO
MSSNFLLPETPAELAARLEFLRLWNLQLDAKQLQGASQDLEREVIAAEGCWRREQQAHEAAFRRLK